MKLDHVQWMAIDVIHPWAACSTLVISDFREDASFISFVKNLNHCMDKKSIGSHAAKKYAFVLASTYQHQKNTKSFLNELGFDCTEESFNAKNMTVVQLHTISVSKLLELQKG